MADRDAPAPAGVTVGLLATAKAYYGLAGPMVISRLGLATMGIADGVMLAHYNTEQLAVHGLADPLAGRAFDVAMAFLFAGLGLAAQARGGDAQAQRGIGRIWRQSLLLAVIVGLLGAGLGAFSEPMLLLSGQTPALARDAGSVMFMLLIGLLPAMLAMSSAGLLEALGRPVLVAVAVVLANVLNIGLNLLLIDGSHGLPVQGALAVALSTTLVRVLLAVVLVGYTWWLPGEARRFGMRGGFSWAEWRAGAEQRARGWTAASGVVLLVGLSLGLPLMAGWLGTAALAQLTAVLLALAPLGVIGWGLCDAAGLRIAAVLGDDGGRGRLRWQGLSLAALAVLLLGLMFIVHGLGARPVLALAIPDAALLERTLRLLPLGLAMLLGDALSFVFVNTLRSLGSLRSPLIVQLAFGAVLLPAAYAMAFPLGAGLAGLLAAHALFALLRALALGLLYMRVASELDLVAKSAMRARDYGSYRKALTRPRVAATVEQKIEPAL